MKADIKRCNSLSAYFLYLTDMKKFRYRRAIAVGAQAPAEESPNTNRHRAS